MLFIRIFSLFHSVSNAFLCFFKSFHSLPNDKILDETKFKAFADDNINFTHNIFMFRFVFDTPVQYDRLYEISGALLLWFDTECKWDTGNASY